MTTENHPASQLIPAGSPSATPAPWNAPNDMWLDVPSEGAGFNVKKFMHSVRRAWLPAALSGLVIAATVAGLLWFLIPETFEASALVRVNLSSRRAIDHRTGPVVNQQEYEIYKQTQAELVKSRFVLTRALRDDEIRNLKLFRGENPETYLERYLQVNYPGRAEILKISLWDRNRDEAKKVVDAVVGAFMDESRQSELDLITERLSILKKSKEENARTMRELSDQVRRLADQVGAEDSEKVKAQQTIQQMNLQRLGQRRDDLRKSLMELQADYMVLQSARQTRAVNPSKDLIADYLESDDIYMEYKQQLSELEMQLLAFQDSVRSGGSIQQRAQGELMALQNAMAKREAELRPRIIAKIKRDEYDTDENKQMLEMSALGVKIRMTQKMIEEADKEYNEKEKALTDLYGDSSEMFARKAELEDLQSQTSEIAAQISEDQLALQVPHRIELLQAAEYPDEGNFWFRLLGITAASLASFVFTVLGFALTDYAANTMSTPTELEKETSLSVLGKLPSLLHASRSMHRRDSFLSNSVDSLRAAITRGDREKEIDSVMVTSAVGKEGKSTVASQLAVSLARSGKKVVLVDADLKNPKQHQIFGALSDRGLCEVLHSEATLDEVVQATPSENLWILPAGTYDPGIEHGLSGNAVGSVLNQLRSQYDFVVVDTGPVLLGPEPMIFGHYVSGAIFATRQDISSIDKVDEAQRRLRSVGIRVLGAVVNGAKPEKARPSAVPALPAT